MLMDYHIHTYLCKHADGYPLEYLEKADAMKLSEIGFADHCPWPDGYDTRYRMTAGEFPSYRNIVQKIRSENNTGITVRYGLEVDWVPGWMGEVFRNLDGEEFDYLIGSIHYIDEFPFDNPNFLKKWDENGAADFVWKKYSDLMEGMVSSGRFDIIGHFDLPKKFGYYPPMYDFFIKKLGAIFSEAAKNGMCLEINTSGLRKPVKEIYPSLEILKTARYYDLGITLGSDAHRPEEVSANFADALKLAKEAGYTEIFGFEKRKAVSFKLPDNLGN